MRFFSCCDQNLNPPTSEKPEPEPLIDKPSNLVPETLIRKSYDIKKGKQ